MRLDKYQAELHPIHADGNISGSFAALVVFLLDLTPFTDPHIVRLLICRDNVIAEFSDKTSASLGAIKDVRENLSHWATIRRQNADRLIAQLDMYQ